MKALIAFGLVWMSILAVPVAGVVGRFSPSTDRTAMSLRQLATIGNSGGYVWPVWGRITDTFGYREAPDHPGGEFHTGVDVAANSGTPVKAAAAGVVVSASWSGNYGNLVIVRHLGPDGPFETWYGHLRKVFVTPGKAVAAGAVIGEVGSTGRSTGPHLHFEYRPGGLPVDPYRLYR